MVEFGNSVCCEAIITRSSGTTLPKSVPIVSAPAKTFDVPMPTLNGSSWLEIEMIADGDHKRPQLSCMLVGETQPIAPVAARKRAAIRSTAVIIGGLNVFIASMGFGILGLDSYSNPDGNLSAWPFVVLIFG
jgi:hypothetical protein